MEQQPTHKHRTSRINMLDLIVCLTMLHKSVHNCQIAIDGADRDHRAVRMQLNLTLLKYKEKASLFSFQLLKRKIDCAITYRTRIT